MDSIGQEKFEELAGKEIFLTILLALFLCSCFSHYAVTDSITTDTQSFLNVVWACIYSVIDFLKKDFQSSQNLWCKEYDTAIQLFLSQS